MRICMITGSFPGRVCGVGDYTARLATALSQKGEDITVITSDEESIREQCPSFPFAVFPLIRKWGFIELLKLRKTVTSLKPDVVHIQYQKSIYNEKAAILFLPMLLKRVIPFARIFTTFHDTEGPWLFPGARRIGLSRVALALLLENCVGIVSGERNGKKLGATLFVNKSSAQTMRLMPIGSNLDATPSPDFNSPRMREKLGIGAEAFLLGTFGFVEASRDYGTILKALKILLQRGRNIHFLSVGGKSKEVLGFTNYAEGLFRQIEEEGLSNYVTFTGYSPPQETTDSLKCSDAGLMLFSDPDYLPQSCALPFLLSLGLPVIIGRGEFLPDCLNDGRNIVMVDPADPISLAAAIDRLITAPETKSAIGGNARELFERVYSFERIAERHISLYQGN